MPTAEEVAKGKQTARSKKGKPTKTGKSGDFRFINFNWTDAAKKTASRFIEGETNLWGYVEQLAGEGYRIGLNFDEYNSCFSASLTNKGGPMDFRGACITARGGTVLAALERLVALHYAIASEDWAYFEQPADTNDLW